MARYANADKLKTDILAKYKKHWEVPCSSEDRLIQSIVTDLRVLIEKNTTADVVPMKENDVPRYIKLPQPEHLPPTAEELEAFATKLYQSPIEIIMQEMQTQFDGEVLKATQAYGINVDKEELIKALQYDRDQYDKGFADGSRIDTTAIRAEVAREIFADVEVLLKETCERGYAGSISDLLADLKKKYTEGQK